MELTEATIGLSTTTKTRNSVVLTYACVQVQALAYVHYYTLVAGIQKCQTMRSIALFSLSVSVCTRQ